MALACPKCFKDDIADARDWRLHMSSKHGGYSTEDLQKAGVTMAGEDEPTGALHVLDGVDGQKRPTTTKAKRAASSDVIGRIILRKAARFPYKAWATVLGDPRMDLTKEEQADLLSIYMEIANSTGADFSGPKFAILAIFITNADMIFARLKLRGFKVPFLDDDEETDEPTAINQ